jgi:uncharacterized protein YbjT (DUF2867 family)
MAENNPLFLVAGATGTQGAATTRALLDAGRRVRILTRNPGGEVAADLARRGAEVAKGDLGEPETLASALRDAYGVFSVQTPDMDGSDSVRRHGFGWVEAARRAGVQHFVHSSVCQVDQHTRFPRWGTGYWDEKYWTDRWEVEQAVRNAGFPRWTMLRPSFLMDNFTHAKAQHMFPDLRRGVIVTPVRPDAAVQLISGDDIGAFARAAFAEPSRFDRQAIEMASETLTMGEIAAVLSRTLHKAVTVDSVSPEEAVAAGQHPGWVRAQEWINDVRYSIDLADAASYGLPLTSFGDWVARHADEIVIKT